MKWKIKIGIETHIKLLTKSKIFNNIPSKFNNKPNTQVNEINLALPGTLPIINKKVIKLALKFGIAICGKIASHLSFCRKNYFYPDLPKGYQITQYKNPIINKGKIFFLDKNKIKFIKLISAHLEEDTGKIFHKYYKNMTGIDYNRSGNALLEVVTEPIIKNSDEAIKYLKSLYNLVTWLNICDGNLQNGSFRSDINISIKKKKDKNNGIKCEIKNLNSFKFIKEAIDYEINRQIKILEKNQNIIQETRSYDPNTKKTKHIRNKIFEKDYKYIPEPDLPKFKIPIKLIKKIKNKIPKLPFLIQKKLIKKYNLSLEDVLFLTINKKIYKYFKQTLLLINKNQIKLFLNWLKFKFILFFKKKKIKKFPLKPNQFSLLLNNIYNKNITNKIAKKIFFKLIKLKKIKNHKINNLINIYKINMNIKNNELELILNKIINNNLNIIKEIKNKNKKILNFIIGKILKKTKNKINPQKIKIFLEKKLKLKKK